MINGKVYEYGSGRLVETGKMLGGWVKGSRVGEGPGLQGEALKLQVKNEPSKTALG